MFALTLSELLGRCNKLFEPGDVPGKKLNTGRENLLERSRRNSPAARVGRQSSKAPTAVAGIRIWRTNNDSLCSEVGVPVAGCRGQVDKILIGIGPVFGILFLVI